MAEERRYAYGTAQELGNTADRVVSSQNDNPNIIFSFYYQATDPFPLAINWEIEKGAGDVENETGAITYTPVEGGFFLFPVELEDRQRRKKGVMLPASALCLVTCTISFQDPEKGSILTAFLSSSLFDI